MPINKKHFVRGVCDRAKFIEIKKIKREADSLPYNDIQFLQCRGGYYPPATR